MRTRETTRFKAVHKGFLFLLLFATFSLSPFRVSIPPRQLLFLNDPPTSVLHNRVPENLLVNFHSIDLDLVNKYGFRTVDCYRPSESEKDINTTVAIQMHNMRDVIRYVCRNSGEIKVNSVMEYVFREYSARGISGLMLDIGANAGYYSLLAAGHGHHAIQFDVQPKCQRILRNEVLQNGFEGRVTTVAAGVSNLHGNITVPNEGCEGQFSPYSEQFSTVDEVTMPTHPLSTFVDSRTRANIILMKVDTEGSEKFVLDGSMEFFEKHLIRNAIVEVTPCCGFYHRAGLKSEDVYRTFADIVGYGYAMVSLWDFNVHRTREAVGHYLSSAQQTQKFEQSDLWFTLEDSIVGMDFLTVPTSHRARIPF